MEKQQSSGQAFYIGAVIVIFLIMAFVKCSGRDTHVFEKAAMSKVSAIKQERDLLKEELLCLQEEINSSKQYDQIITITDEKYKSKYFELLKQYQGLQSELINIRTIVLPYAALDSLSGVVQYPKE